MSDPHITIGQPWWLLGLVALAPVVYYHVRRSLVQRPRWQRRSALALRIALIVVLVVALADVRINYQSTEPYTVFAVDQSASVEWSSPTAAKDFLESVPASHDVSSNPSKTRSTEGRSAIWAFSGISSIDSSSDKDDTTTSTQNKTLGTNIEEAICSAQTVLPSDRPRRIVLLSDGNQTQDNALAAARQSAVPIDVVALPGQPKDEVYVAAIDVPDKVRLGVPFVVEVVLHASGDNRGELTLVVDDSRQIEQRSVDVKRGENRFSFPMLVNQGERPTFTAKIDGFRDTIAENNRAAIALLAGPRPRVLLVESQPATAQPLADALRADHFDVDVRAAEEFSSEMHDLQPYDVLILSNVSATSLSAEQMQLLNRYVHDGGGGLIVVGGPRAFTPGGYRETVLEEMLPVRCHVNENTQKPTLAMVLVIDRSGSMQGKSIALAKQATRQAVEMLGPRDQVGVIAFEDRNDWVAELQPCGDKQHIIEQIDTITAAGGTNLFPALEKAFLALRETDADLKHVIVLTDGVSLPGDFEQLTKDMARSDITVSTVAVGDEAAQDLLQDIAALGAGHYYFCAKAESVPRIFALETVSAAKQGITERPFFPRVVESSELLTGLDMSAAPTLLGYADTRVKPSAQLVLASADNAPVLAWWQYGQGRTMVFTSDAQSRWAAAWLRWPDFGPFWGRLVRHNLRRDPTRNFHFQVRSHDTYTDVILDAVTPDGQWINGADVTLKVARGDTDRRSLRLPPVAAGRYAARVGLPDHHIGLPLQFDVELQGPSAMVYRNGRTVVSPAMDELRVRPADTDLLQAIAQTTDGRYGIGPEEITTVAAVPVPQTWHAWRACLVAVLLLFLSDVAIKRLATR